MSQTNIKLRQLQVDGVLKRFPNARTISYDRSVVDVPLLMKSTQITFRITMPPAFPDVPPQVVVQARCANHPLLNQYSVVMYPELSHNKWNRHSSLADVMSFIFSEFRQNPPKVVSYAAPPVAPVQTYQPQPVHHPSPSPSQSQSQSQLPSQPSPAPVTQRPLPEKPRVQIPQAPMSYEEVEKLDSATLESLLREPENSEKWNAFFEGLEFVKNLGVLRQSLSSENEKLAEKNIEKDRELVKMFNTNQELCQLMKDTMGELDQTTKEKTEIDQRYSPMPLLKLLKAKIEEGERESDEIVDKYLDDGDPSATDSFIKSFMEKRVLMHLRLAKKDRFEKIYCR